MRDAIVVGGGAAGLRAATRLAGSGLRVTLIEREAELGGKLKGWYHLFPSLTPASEVLAELKAAFEASGAEVIHGEATSVSGSAVTLADGRELQARAVLLASGFTLFDAGRKEEYGYGIYPQVYTSVDIERMLSAGSLDELGHPRRIALLHCVGSRDEKVCQPHCSKVCCITGVKQAVELKQRFPEAEVFNFYMDIRMFGPGYEELYRAAQQEHNIHFVRGRISEVSPTFEKRLQIKAEDTLTGRPLRMSVDTLVLLVGMQANAENGAFADANAVPISSSGFLRARDLFLHGAESGAEGLFYAGTVTAPKTLGESLDEAVAAADQMITWIGDTASASRA